MAFCDGCKQLFKRLYRIPCCILCLLTLLVQDALMNYILVTKNNLFWCLWAIADVLVLAAFLTAFVFSYRLLKSRSYKLSEGDSTRNSIPGELPLGYIVWFFYSVVLSTKIAILYGPGYNIAANMTKNELIGSSSLKSAVAISSIIFFLFVVTHHDAQPKSDRESYINNIVYHVTIDILDTTQFLNVLFTQETRAILTFGLDRAIIAFACINLILPTLLLVGLSRTKFGRTTCSRRYEFLHKIFYYMLVNVPMLVIRSILSHIHDQPVSVFLIKNVIGCGIIVKEVSDHVLVPPATTPSAIVQSDMAMIDLSSNKKDEIEAIPLEVKSHSQSSTT